MFLPDDIEELEGHLRELISDFKKSGWSEVDAFHWATKKMGDYGFVEKEYRKVRWTKPKRRRRFRRSLYWEIIMLRNYFKTAFRMLRKQKAFTALNIAGLSIGMALSILVLLFIQYELSFDGFHEKADQIYRVNRAGFDPASGAFEMPLTSPLLAQDLSDEFPEIVMTTRIWRKSFVKFKVEDRLFLESEYLYADANVFDVFDIRLVRGNPKTALVNPNSVVLTEEMAEKYFGDEDPIGQTIGVGVWIAYASTWGPETPAEVVDPSGDYTVTGILEPYPDNSHLQIKFLLSFSTFYWWEWGGKNLYEMFQIGTYVVLPKDYSPELLEAKTRPMAGRHRIEYFQRNPELSRDEFEKAGYYFQYSLQPVTDVYLSSEVPSELYGSGPDGDLSIDRRGNPKEWYFLGLIALVVLLISVINFVNLTTARSATRAREVGVRKVVGSLRQQLVGQFMIESLLMTGLALILAVVLAQALLPVFNRLIDTTIPFASFVNGWGLPSLIALAVVVGLVAGSYPAIILSSYRPVDVLKGTQNVGSRGAWLRNGLVVFQFGISIALIVTTLVVLNQLSYMRNKDLGFDKENIIVQHGMIDEPAVETYKQEVLRHPNVISVSNLFWPTFIGDQEVSSPVRLEGTPVDEAVRMQWSIVDYDIVETLGLDIISGEHPSTSPLMTPNRNGIPAGLILNETAVKGLGLSNPIGQRLLAGSMNWPLNVIAVIKDIHSNTLHAPVPPMYIEVHPSLWRMRTSYIRIGGGDAQSTLAFLKSTAQNIKPGVAFEYSFLDAELDLAYRESEQLGRIFFIFSLLAIGIACLGIFGLAAFMAQQRTKEIGVRKVLGASAQNITLLLSKDFVLLVGIAFLIASPLAYFAMQRWLEDFAYHFDIGFGLIALAGVAALVLALLSVSYQSLKASLANPVDSIRYE
ncbi:MAG: ABC transporter permease [Bacteroidetes bacterium]|nr:ABC transporter permease [Bacteroidota bacterium]